jgi:hypothetical protein
MEGEKYGYNYSSKKRDECECSNPDGTTEEVGFDLEREQNVHSREGTWVNFLVPAPIWECMPKSPFNFPSMSAWQARFYQH